MPSKYKDLFIMSGVVEGVSIARVTSRLRYEIKKVMSHAYLEDLEDAIEKAIQFEMFVKFEEIYKHQA